MEETGEVEMKDGDDVKRVTKDESADAKMDVDTAD